MIYFIQGELTERIKIGFTARFIEQRMQDLQTGSPDKLLFLGGLPGDVNEENAMHYRFRKFRLHGEWFEPGPELVEFIRNKTFRTTDAVYNAVALVKYQKLSVAESLKLNNSELSKMYGEHIADLLDGDDT